MKKASKFKPQVIPGGINSSANYSRSAVKAETNAESTLSHQDIHFIKEMREKIANIPTETEDDCCDALTRFEGPDNVHSRFQDGTLFTYDRRGLFSTQEKTKDGYVPVKIYLERLFKNRVENIIKLNGG